MARLASQPFAATWSQSAKPRSQVNAQALSWHAARPFCGTAQAAQVGPHAVGSVSATHRPPHAWNVLRHVNEQAPRTHALEALVTAGQRTPHAPQFVSDDIGSTHALAQSRGAAGAQPFVHRKPLPAGAHSGAAAGQATLQLPQLVGCERSISHPSFARALQSA